MSLIEFSELETAISELILQTPSPGKHSARSAIRHIQMAFLLESIDKEMAAFRAITGEEEAATALFHAFQQRKYPGSDNLDPYDHNQKAAVYPFLIALSQAVNEAAGALGLEFGSQLFNDKKKKYFRTTITYPDGRVGICRPPLNFTLSADGKLYDFTDHIRKLEKERNVKTIRDDVRKRANLRNQILYASSQGIPHLEDLGKLLPNSRERIFHILLAYLHVAPFPVQDGGLQCLQGFLKMLRLVGPIDPNRS